MAALMLVAAAVGSLLAAGCGRGSGREESAATAALGKGPVVTPVTGKEVLAAVHSSRAKVVLVNVWATWCEPCREEFPDLLRVRRAHSRQELDVILVSGDFPDQLSKVRAFLTEQGVDFPTYLKEEKDMPFINALSPRWSGALPATFVYDGQRGLVAFWEGKASAERFEEAVRRALEDSAKQGGG
jgi:thiol-disulfide isomerase/thioredoxin